MPEIGRGKPAQIEMMLHEIMGFWLVKHGRLLMQSFLIDIEYYIRQGHSFVGTDDGD